MKKVIGFIVFVAIMLVNCGSKPTPRYMISDILEAGDGYVIVVCHECNGMSEIPCPSCNGTGKMPCMDCGGQYCTKCDGSGYVNCTLCGGGCTVDCLECNGTGEIRYSVPKKRK